jgi:hypothetical protein
LPVENRWTRAKKNPHRAGRNKKPAERVSGRKIPVQVRSFDPAITNAGNKKPAESG